jgi:hypothetical protein
MHSAHQLYLCSCNLSPLLLLPPCCCCHPAAAAADDQLLGSLTEQDPARFYQLMDHLVRHVQPANLQVLLPMSASFLTRSLTKDDTQQQQQQQQSGDSSDDASQKGTGESSANANSSSSTSSGSSSEEGVSADDVAAAMHGGKLLSGRYAVRTKKSMVILSDYAVCRSFAAALHGYSKSVVGPVLSQQQQQDADATPPAAANGSSSSNGQQQQQWYIDHDTPVHYVLPPLQKVAEWLAVGLEDAIITALQGQEEAAAAPAAAAPAAAVAVEAKENGNGISNSSSSSSSRPKSPKKAAKQQQQQAQEQQQLAPQAVAAQVKSASQAAACSLVLITLLARAAVPVLQELQLSLQELPTAAPAAAAAAGSADSSSSSSSTPAANADALVTESGAVDLLAGLMFVRAAYQALCARCYLTQVINGLPGKLSDSRPAAGATAADVAAVQAIKAALKGQGLARGWAHLVQPVPPKVVIRVRGFQDQHPGDFVASLNLLQQLQPVGVIEESSNAAESAAEDSAAAAAVPQMMLQMKSEMRKQLGSSLTDLLGLFSSLLSEVPLPVGCNNPACTNLEGVAEASLSVNKRCKSCLAAHYCSKQCQTEHWAAHKGACQRIRSLSQA